MCISESSIRVFELFEMHLRLLVYVESGLIQKISKREGIEDMCRNFQGYYGEIVCGNSTRAQSKNEVEFSGLSEKSCRIFLGLGFLRCVTLFCRVFILEVKFRTEILFFCNIEERVKGFGFFLK